MEIYHPIAVLSLAIDFYFHQLDPHGFHATSIILHLINVLLVFVFIRVLTKQMMVAFITALLFGIHPMHVESVSWWPNEKIYCIYCFIWLSLIAYTLFPE